jgi:uncharacterized protein YggE
MRNSMIIALAMLPALAQGQSARMDAGDPEPRIVVTATRTTRLAPDRAALYITVEGSGETPTEASRRAAQKLQTVTTAIQPFGGDAIVSVPYGVAPAPNINGFPGASSQTSFIARYMLRVQPSRIDQITPLAVAAIAAGASSATPPTFEASGADSARRQRYGEALMQARRDAETLATALGGRLGAVIEVSTNNGERDFPGSSGFVNFINGYEFRGPVQPPEIVVSATVTVRYRFIP